MIFYMLFNPWSQKIYWKKTCVFVLKCWKPIILWKYIAQACWFNLKYLENCTPNKCTNNVVNLAHFIIFFFGNSYLAIVGVFWFIFLGFSYFFCLGVCGTFIQNAVTKTYKLRKCMWINTFFYHKVFLLQIFFKCQSGIFVNLNVLFHNPFWNYLREAFK